MIKPDKIPLGIGILLILILQSCMPQYSPETTKAVDKLDLKRYTGKWYEIYRLPMRAEKDLVNVTASYSLRQDGRINVLNEGYKHHPGGKHKKAKAIAWRPNEEVPGALIVRFFRLIKSSYIVLAIDESYNWAVVSTLNRDYAWILSRTPQIEPELRRQLIDTANFYNIDTNRFIKTEQEWDQKNM